MNPAEFKAPFTFDGIAYIWDSQSNMAADMHHGTVRARGWGRIQYLREPRGGEEANALMDEWEAWVAEAAGECTDGDRAAELMNEKAKGNQ